MSRGNNNGGNSDETPKASPSKLHKILKRAHDAKKTERAIADTAKGRRIKKQQDKKEGDKK